MFASITMLAEAAGEAAHEVAKSGLPQLNTDTFVPQLFWLVLTFVTLLFVMSKIALPRVGEVIEERAESIRRDVAAAGRLKTDTDKALANYEKALADARSNASGIAKQTRDKLAAETEAEKARAEASITAKFADAENRIAATKTKALTAVNDIAAETAQAVVSKLVGQDVSLDDVRKVLQPAVVK